MFWTIVFCYVMVMTSVTFTLYGYDKSQAVRYGWRVPEIVLLSFGLFGGTIGALLGMRMFRHKRKKGSYLVKFWGATLLQFLIVIYYPERVEAIVDTAGRLFF